MAKKPITAFPCPFNDCKQHIDLPTEFEQNLIEIDANRKFSVQCDACFGWIDISEAQVRAAIDETAFNAAFTSGITSHE